MAHGHDHSHDEHYFLDQIATVAACGLLAGIGFLVWRVDLLMKFNILTEQFNLPVMLGSLALTGLVIVRGLTLWGEVRGKKSHASTHAHTHSHDHDHDHDHHHEHHHHDHKPGEPCDHDHHHHAPGETCDHEHHEHHEHGHVQSHSHSHDDHEHGFAPWRYAVILLPLLLSGLLLYYHFQGMQLTYSAERLANLVGQAQVLEGGDAEEKVKKGEGVLSPGLRELSDAGANVGLREYWDGRYAELRGLIAPVSDREFTLFRLKMTCCAADSVPVKVRIFAKDSLSRFGVQRGKGVKVVGQVQFRKVQDSGDYVPIIVASEITPMDLKNDIYDKGS